MVTEPTVDWIGPGGQRLAGPAGAVAAEVQEYDAQGVPAGRTYAELAPAAARVVLAQTAEDEDVADPDSADYLKDTWDLYDTDHEPVTTLRQLLAVLGAGDDDGQRRTALLGAIEVPSWQAAPDALRAEAYAWLDGHPPTAGTDGA